MASRKILTLGFFFLFTAVSSPRAQEMTQAPANMQHHPSAPINDDRQAVTMPDAIRRRTLANMRDHLRALEQIQEALSNGQFDAAGDIAEERLGMSALRIQGAHEGAKYKPAGMQEIGGKMHHAASRFAIVAKDASVTGDMKSALVALSRVMQQCVACHSSYRVQ